MVPRQQQQLPPLVRRHYCAAVTHVPDVALFPNDQTDESTGARPIVKVLSIKSFDCKPPFSLQTRTSQGLCRIRRKALMSQNHLMQLLLQKISTQSTPVPIINSKKRTRRPLTLKDLSLRFRYIHDNSYTILIVFPADSLMRVGGI